MENKKSSWSKVPSRRQLILFTLSWGIGIALLAMAATDLFSQSIFQGEYLLLYLLVLVSTFATVKMHINYWKQ